MLVVTGAGRLQEWSQGELRLYQHLNTRWDLIYNGNSAFNTECDRTSLDYGCRLSSV